MFQQAAQEYREAESKEQSEESIFGEGYELILAGSIADGMNVFDAGIRMYPRSIPLRIGAGTAQCLLGKTSDGLRNFLDATDIDPADPRPYSFLASASGISNDESDRVRKSFMRFLDREPNNGSASFFCALALSRANPASDTDRIEVLLQRAIQFDPNLAKAHLLLDYIFLEITTVLMLRRDLSVATRVGRILLDAEELEFVPCSDLFSQTIETFSNQAGTRLSFADAAIASVARSRADGQILSFDEEFKKLASLRINPDST